MTVLIILLCAVILIHVLMITRERIRGLRQEDAAVAPVEEFVSAPHRRRRALRNSLVGLVDHAGNSWRLFKDERVSKAVSGEIVSAAKLAPADSGRARVASIPPPVQGE